MSTSGITWEIAIVPDEHGETIDWLSIYRHGHDGEAENIWSYVLFSYFRDDPFVIYKEIKSKRPDDALWGVFEIAAFLSVYVLGFLVNWKFMLFFLPFYYVGPLPFLSEWILSSFWRQS